MLAIIFCAWAIISGVIMLGSMVFTGAGACDARAADQQLCARREGTEEFDGGERSISLGDFDGSQTVTGCH